MTSVNLILEAQVCQKLKFVKKLKFNDENSLP